MRIITFFLLSTLIGFSQQEKNDLALENLKGDVQTYQNRTYIIETETKDEVLKYNDKHSFNTNGMTNSIENFGDDSVIDSKEIYNYKQDQLTKITVFNTSGKASKTTIFEYNATGNILSQKKYNSQDKLQYITGYTYNEEGQLITQKKLIPSINYTMKESYTYDKQNNLIEISKTARVGTIKQTFENDEKGLLSKKSDYNAMGQLYSVIEYEYNKQNDKVSLKKYDAEGIKTYYESYKYIYDKHDNWIMRVSFEKGKKVSVEKREIEYY